MKCELHPNLDAVGNCVYCGRGVCEDCKVKINELVHCKECVEAGRIKGGQVRPPPPPRPAPGQPGQMPFMPPPMRHMPRPRGPLKPVLFKYGAAGSLLSGVFMIAMGGSVIFWSYDRPPGGSLSLILMFVMNIIGLIFLALGCYGIYWNYGSMSGMAGIIGMLIMIPLLLFAAGSTWRSYSSYDDDVSASSFFNSGLALLYAVTYTLMHLSIAYARHYVPIWHTARKAMAAARATSIVGVGFLYSIILLSFVGYIVVGVAYILFALFFLMAPMPDQPAQVPQQPYHAMPGTVPPPMRPPGVGPMTGRTI
jgi:hypothetical protein